MPHQKKLSNDWLVGITNEGQRADTLYTISNNSIVREQLAAFCSRQIETLEKVPTKDYENAAWPYKMADRNGELRAYRRILEMTNL